MTLRPFPRILIIYQVIFVVGCALASQLVQATEINTVFVTLEEKLGNLPDEFAIRFESTNPSAEVSEVAVDLSRSIGGVKFDTAASKDFNVGTGGGLFTNYGKDFKIVNDGGVTLTTPLDKAFQKSLDGSPYLPGYKPGETRQPLGFDNFTAGKTISFTGDFDRTKPTEHPFVLPAHLEGGLVGARIISPDSPDTVAVGKFTDIGATAKALPIILPPSTKVLLGELKKDQPTYVLTHGLQSEDDINNNDKLWTGFNEGQAGWLLENNLNNANIVQYIWKDAFQHSGKVPEDNGYTEAWQYIPGAGAYLGKELLTALGPDYQESIHFIGHSMGTAVNTYAARLFLNYADQVKSAQFTSLDRPDHIEQIPGFNGLFGDDEEKYRFDSDFFAVNLPTDIEIKIDNYYSLDKNSATGVGDIADYLQGQTVFNHQLTNPHEVGGTFFDGEGTDNDHSGVHQWYRWTIDPNRGYFTNSDGLKVATAFQAGLKLEGDIRGLVQPFCLGNQYFTKLSNLHGSMNPCEYGWNIGSNKLGELFKEDFPKNDGVLLDVTQEQLSLLDFISIGNCEAIGGESSGILCKEGSSSFGMAQIDLPSTAEYLMFDYLSPSIGNDDFITVFLDDIAIWTIGGESVIGGSYVESGYIPIRGLTGSRILTLALNGFGEKNAEFEVRNLRAVTLTESTVRVPEPTTLALMGLGLAGIGYKRHRSKIAA